MAAVEAPFSHFYHSRSKVGYFEGKQNFKRISSEFFYLRRLALVPFLGLSPLPPHSC